jgi:hypothetical protein
MTPDKSGSPGDEKFHENPNLAEEESFEKTGK